MTTKENLKVRGLEVTTNTDALPKPIQNSHGDRAGVLTGRYRDSKDGRLYEVRLDRPIGNDRVIWFAHYHLSVPTEGVEL